MTDLQTPQAHETGSGLTELSATRVLQERNQLAETQPTAPRQTRRYKPRARKCARRGCNIIFTPKARHGKYCSDICRKRDHRRKQRRLRKPQPRQKVLELFTCWHCEQTFLATKNSGARYCKPYHRDAAYEKRKQATVKAIMGDMNVTEKEAAEGLELSGMKKATQYFTQKGYQYDARRHAWVLPVELQQELSISTT